MRRELTGVGIGWRRELAGSLLAERGAVDFVEVVAEACREPRSLREARAVAEIWPVVPHGVKLSLGSAEGIEVDRARFLGKLARELRAPVVSEHVSFVRAGGREIGHLTELPMTREVVDVVVRNVDRLRRELPDVPLLLENVARGFLWPTTSETLDEGDFHAEIVLRTGCDLLLDVGNLYANAVNAGRHPEELLARYPLERVAMLHVAGGVTEGGFYFDTHAHPVPEPVHALVARALEHVPHATVLLERDAALEDPGAILAEVARLRATPRGAPVGRPTPRAPEPPSSSPSPALARAQADLARRLTEDEPTEDRALMRAREVLVRKRVDDALPLLRQLGSRISTCEALELGRVAEAPRLPTMTAVADALRIARGARSRPDLARYAAEDELVLRARFGDDEARPLPRRGPFLGRAVLDDGRAVWTFKGFGRAAAVRVYEPGARR